MLPIEDQLPHQFGALLHILIKYLLLDLLLFYFYFISAFLFFFFSYLLFGSLLGFVRLVLLVYPSLGTAQHIVQHANTNKYDSKKRAPRKNVKEKMGMNSIGTQWRTHLL